MHCSRFGHAPDNCLALVIDGVLTHEECAEIIDRKDNDLRYPGPPMQNTLPPARPTPKFTAVSARYVREALRVVDGVPYSVPIQNPRKYALGVYEDPPFAEELWRRLQAVPGVAAGVAAFAARDAAGEALGLNQRLRVLRYAAPPPPPPPASGATVPPARPVAQPAEGLSPPADNAAASAAASAPAPAAATGANKGGAPDQFEPHYDQVGACVARLREWIGVING